LAKEQGGELRLVHIVDELTVTDYYGAGLYIDDLIQSMRENGRKILDGAESIARQQGVAPQRVLLESAGRAVVDSVLEQAKEWPADLIVMGTHGRRGIRRLALGSDAEQILRSSPCPVLLVRAAAKSSAESAATRDARSQR
jgi:nucleotide-binding universal stress UspA family protein